MQRFLFMVSIIVTMFTAGSTAGAQEAGELSGRLSATLDSLRMRHGFPGVTAAIVLPDGTMAEAASGLADVEEARPMSPATPMLAASIGKSLVAATVLALESEGHLSRADRLLAHLGDRPWFSALPNARSITIDHLLHHSSGLPDHVQLPAFQSAWPRLMSREGQVAPEELIGFVTGRAPLFEAGAGWAYSDTGYILLGLLIEEVTGQPFHDEVRRRFLEPRELADTFPSDRRDLTGLAIGYTAPDNPFGLPERTADAEGVLLWNPDMEGAGGGFASTSGDLARWGHLLFDGEAMAVPYLERLLDGIAVDADTPDVRYGAGVAIHADTPRGPVYGHGGWIPGYVSSLRHYADHGVTVAFQVNTDVGFIKDDSELASTLEAALVDLLLRPDTRIRPPGRPGRSPRSAGRTTGRP